jgi:hypothetical protein
VAKKIQENKMKFTKMLVIGSIFLIPFVRRAYAENDYENTLREKSMIIHSTMTVAANTSTTSIVISLSSTTVWPHQQTGSIGISDIKFELDKLAASSVTIRMGVINFVDISSGSVTWFLDRSFIKNVSNTDPFTDFHSDNASYELYVKPGSSPTSNGTTTRILSNEITDHSTAFETDTNLPSPVGMWPPHVGDIVLEVTNNDGTNAVNILYTIMYHSHAR